MGAKPQTIGGGSAKGVSSELSNFLLQGLQGGFQIPQYGQTTAGSAMSRTDPFGSTMDIGQAIGTLLAGGNNLANGAMAIADNRRKENVADLRSRYSLGGTGYGTPAATAEARFLGEFDPQVATQVGGLQLDSISRALSHVLPLYSQAYGLGTPQAQTVMKKGWLGETLGAVSGLAGAALPFFAPGIGGAASAGMNAAQSMAANGFGVTPPATLPFSNPSFRAGPGQLGQASMYHFGNNGFLPQIEGIGSVWGGYNNFPGRGGRDSFGTPSGMRRLW